MTKMENTFNSVLEIAAQTSRLKKSGALAYNKYVPVCIRKLMIVIDTSDIVGTSVLTVTVSSDDTGTVHHKLLLQIFVFFYHF